MSTEYLLENLQPHQSINNFFGEMYNDADSSLDVIPDRKESMFSARTSSLPARPDIDL